VNSLAHKCAEINLEKKRLIEELKTSQENIHSIKQALNQEIDALKERESALRKTNELLEQGLEEQKRANLDSYGQGNKQASQEANSSIERNLILEERVAKAEAESEQLRAQRLNAIEELKAQKNKLQEALLELSQVKMEFKIIEDKLAVKQDATR